MADLEFESYDGGYEAPQRFGRAINIAGAVCSVALVLGLGVWGYRLAVRDVTGVPVFRAIEGPLRVAPADPGGQQAMHQGLSVNAVAAAGTARPVPESLRLAPKDVDLTAEDVAGLADLPLSAQPASDVIADQQAVIPAPAVAAEEQSAVSAAIAEAVSGEEGAVPAEDAVATDTALADAISEAVAVPEPVVPAIAAARPRARPANLHLASATPAKIDAPAAAVVAAPIPDPASLTAGAQLVQLGAFDDEAQAGREWERLQGQFVDLFAGKAMVVQAAQSGGRTFYRLRAAGFGGAEDARAFCNTLLSGNSTCIPVTQR
ncbi:SPOR domain-containing protein [Fuscibacter oryzae]|uniref:SPOR domain-containing protein n=1 Tax=Fuscibacter oryzae TaxID=2803939 RepID=A0A8J7MN87_9RHOB|nr:SPOR domain-containing protein [Fuscibacter oryzae]MBL4927975.1 SPOR domain-containing protein [Fuscibacter oryzae]